MYRIVLGPATFLKGMLNPHSICTYLLFEYADRYRAIFSDKTARAFSLFVLHPLIIIRFPHISKLSLTRLDRILLRAERVRVPAGLDSNMFIAVARAAQADYLVCQDPELQEKCNQLGVPTLTPTAFIDLIAPDHALRVRPQLPSYFRRAQKRRQRRRSYDYDRDYDRE